MWWCAGDVHIPNGKPIVSLAFCLLIPWIAMTLVGGFLPDVFSCPRVCFCFPRSKNLLCADKGLPVIPSAIPSDTIELNLNGNRFTNKDLVRENFTRFSFLEELHLKNCGIKRIAPKTFSDLNHLRELDLSFNHIWSLADYTFLNLRLNHLTLSGNVGLKLSPGVFEGMTTRALYMRNCGLTHLQAALVNPLKGSLKFLWVNKNNIWFLSYKLLPVLRSLLSVKLGGNPFHCDCRLKWLHRFYLQHANTTTSLPMVDVPTCHSPAYVQNMTFDDLTVHDFSCQLFKILHTRNKLKLTKGYYARPDQSVGYKSLQEASDFTRKAPSKSSRRD